MRRIVRDGYGRSKRMIKRGESQRKGEVEEQKRRSDKGYVKKKKKVISTECTSGRQKRKRR